jgi:hypothetical protein
MTKWLESERRKLFAISVVKSLFAIGGGSVVFALTLFPIYLFVQILTLAAIPWVTPATILSVIIMGIFASVIMMDNFRTSRDDMSIIPFWLLREYVHMGPRLIMVGVNAAIDARTLMHLDFEMCKSVLAYLAGKNMAASREELLRAFPQVNWRKLLSYLRLFSGVILLGRDKSRISLTLVFRLQLRRLLRQEANAGPEAQLPPPAEQPEILSPHEILGVRPNASIQEIKAAYRTRIKECHPDRFAGMDERSIQLAEEWTKSLNAAYHELLSQNSGTKRRR